MSCKITICMLIMLAAVCSAATYDYCDVLSKSLLFYEAQRSGRLPSNNRIPWRSNSALSDATSSSAATDSNGDGNLAGGYYDAGDGVKFGYPMAFTATTLAWGFIESESAITACGQTDNYLAAIKWATDWFIKAHTAPNEFYGQVGNGGLDHSFWGPPEMMTMSRPAYKIDAQRPGTDLAMEVAAALAAASIVFKNRNPTYSATLLTHARQMYTFGYTYRGLYHDSIPDAAIYYRSYGFNDELVWGSSWLYRATQEASYLTAAQNDYNTFGMAYMAPGQSFDWDQKSPGVLVNMWKATGDSRYLTDAQRWLTSWTPGNGITYTPGGLAWLREWGPLRYTSGSAFLALLIGTSASNTWGKGQIDYMLGSNPQSRSYVVGFGSNSPINPHHRAAHGSTTNDINNPVNNRYILTGALVGGPGANDDYVDSRQDYVKNEVACDYNAAFTAAVAALAKLSGTGPTPTTRPTSAPTNGPTTAPTAPPTTKPTSAPTSAPTTRPTSAPTSAPTSSPSGSISVELNSGVNLFWFAVKISGESQTTQKVEVKDSSPLSAWGVATATNWGFWVFSPASALVLPISLRLTSSAGQQVLINNIITSITDFSKINTNVQYGSSGPTTPPTPTPTSTPTSRPPTSPPTTRPTNAPTAAPTTAPTAAPTTRPTSAPTAAPTAAPTTRPTSAPTAAPTTRPTSAPPTAAPTTRPTTTLKVLVNPGSNAYWFALQIQDAAVTVRSVEFKDSGRITDYIAFTQESWGAWTYQAVGDKTVTGPVTVRITGTNGKTITFPVSNISPSTLTDSGLQL